tara:strand:- start:231 stop:668 length:438 start_codon:yes stop_codon:yes gene_type:complete
MQDLKYLSAYLVPLSAFVGITIGGVFIYLTVIFVFGLIPLLELISPHDTSNLDDEGRQRKSSNKWFTVLLYLNIPIVYGILIYALFTATQNNLQIYEFIGLFLTTGIVLGSNGINVAHELGHRQIRQKRQWQKFYFSPRSTCTFL